MAIYGNVLGVKKKGNDKFILTKNNDAYHLFQIQKSGSYNWANNIVNIDISHLKILIDMLSNDYNDFSLDQLEQYSKPGEMTRE